MTDDGHANDLAGLYLTWHRSSPEEWKALIAGGFGERVDLYPIRCPNRYVLWGRGIKSLGLCSNGVSVTGRCAQQVADGRREFMAAIARLCTSSPLLSQLDATIFPPIPLGRLYWQSSQCEDNTSLREALTLYKIR
ncbi:putative tRNA ligase [Escherichia coli]|nr:putative tRNA ligase [Escherichia coli]